MSDLSKRNASSSSASAGKQSNSLSQLLKSSKSNLNAGPSRKALPSLEDLQKRLTGGQQANAKLNLSSALSLNPTDGVLTFQDKSAASANCDKNLVDSQMNGGFGTKLNLTKQQSRDFGSREASKFQHKYKQDAHAGSGSDIEKIVEKIEKTKTVYFDEESKFAKDKITSFHHIRLPKHFNPFRGYVNVYRSGMIEIVDKEGSEKFTFKQALFNSEKVTDDLIIHNDTVQMIESINILISGSIENSP